MAEQSHNSKVSRLLSGLRQNRLRSLLIGGGVLLAIVAAVGISVYSRPPQQQGDTYQEALQAVDAGDFKTARKLAAELYKAPLSYERSGAPFYVLGSAAALEAEESLDARHRNALLVLATRYLEEARQRGFPPGRELDGSLRLAQSLFDSGQYAACLPIVVPLVESAKEPIPAAERLLAGAYLRDSDPQHEQALLHIRRYLSTPEITAEQQHQGQMEQVRILIALNRLQEAEEVLRAQAPAETTSAQLLLQGQLALARSRQTNPPNAGDQLQAIALLQNAIDRDLTNSHVKPQAEYLLGLTQHESGNDNAAIRHLSRVRRLYESEPEGWAASLAEGELLLARGENEAALEALRTAAKAAGEATYYSSPWIGLIEFRSRLRAAFSVWTERGEFALANEYAKTLPPIIPLDESVQLRADAYRLWGESLTEQAKQALPSDRVAMQAEARERHRKAAKFYAWLAELRFATTSYPQDIWNSSQQYLAGHDYAAAAKWLEKYLEVELREQRPEALTSLAQAHLSLSNLDQAQEAVDTVLENFSQHPETYRARLIGSDIWLQRRTKGADNELVHLDKASSLLAANLTEDALTPRSLEWRDSLFALGHVLLLKANMLETKSRDLGVDLRDDVESTELGLQALEKAHEAYQLAIDRLDEATQRYPDAPQALQAQYELAEAYRNAAKFPRKKLPLVLIQTSRVQLQRQMTEQLSQAYDIYRDLQDRLNQKQERGDISENELAILRNCYFARADVLFDQGRYEEAIREYSTASNRYQHEPSALEAFVQIASCYRQLGRPYEARGTLAQAKVVLDRIRDDADFTSTTRFDRRQWESLLELLSSL